MGAYDCDCINNLEYDRRERKAQLSQEGTTSDLISRQAAIESIRECAEAAHDNHEWDMGQGYLNAIECIEEEPPAQPEPHEGYWIEGGIYRDVIECYCSECGQLMTTAATVRMNFCPHCGAKMINK